MGKSHSHVVKGRTQANGKHSLGYKDILITQHAKFRCLERVPEHIIPRSSIQDIRKLATHARKYGVNITCMNRLSDEKLLDLDISRAQSEQIYTKYCAQIEKIHSTKCFFYKYFIFFFAGKKSKTLISVIPALSDSDMDIVLAPDHVTFKDYSTSEVAYIE